MAARIKTIQARDRRRLQWPPRRPVQHLAPGASQATEGLVADDDLDADRVRLYLQRMGCTVFTAVDGESTC